MPRRANRVNSIPFAPNLPLLARVLCQYLPPGFPPPESLASSLAGKHLRPLAARVALDEAAPLELTIALPNFGVLVRVVAPPATHEVAAVRVQRRAVAQAALGAHAPRGRVLLAVVGRPLDVHEVCIQGLAVALSLLHLEVGGLAQSARPDDLDVHGLVVLVLEYVADLAELGECRPAGLGGAGARDAVALALQLHPFF